MKISHQRPTASPRRDRLSPEQQLNMLAAALPEHQWFQATLKQQGLEEPRRGNLRVLQINLGRLCNMRCSHCHVDAGPDRGDTLMADVVVEQCLAAIKRLQPQTVDLTGGAPELHPRFRELVRTARQQGCHVIDRCNLTVLLLPDQMDLASFLAEQEVEIVASLPQPEAGATDAQRGRGTWEASITALRRLNSLGYGQGDAQRQLTLMSNPCGTHLQQLTSCIQQTWKQQLHQQAGVSFDKLISLNNMPIARFLEQLQRESQVEDYMEMLQKEFNKEAIKGLMCRDTVSVAPNGLLHDCDFNQMLQLQLRKHRTGSSEHSSEALSIASLERVDLKNNEIQWANHCFGCTAGQGSSCSGTTA
jgi:radical SAM/Cys-rich protein